MIRINLLPVRERRKRRAGAQLLVIGAALLFGQVYGLQMVHQQKSSRVEKMRKQLRKTLNTNKNLEEIKSAATAKESELKKVKNQLKSYTKLEAYRSGPANMLLFLSYALKVRASDNTTAPKDGIGSKMEKKALTSAGWRVIRREDPETNLEIPEWDPNQIWIRKLIQMEDGLVIEGVAINHESVAEFSRRLSTGPFFPEMRQVQQKEFLDTRLARKTIQYRLESKIDYELPELPDEPEPN
ncbi:MAG: hypothetical protein CMH54_13460 [Myxococcales bacterium]|nr:hypothetical protein [Myxococcales bacterium]|tara:strand:- start:616 stop:1338 length:723 start_codon:yes stop_codon:yes gene_type:complete